MILLVRGTKESGYYADRIAIAIASTAMQRYAKRVLCLQMTARYKMQNVLMGKRLESNNIHTAEFSFEDTGLDALLRRVEAGQLGSEQFSDCCINVAKQINSFDIAQTTKNANVESYLLENIKLVGELLKNANIVYDLVIVLADASKTELLEKLEEMADREIVCIPQGPKKDVTAKADVMYAIKNYDNLSCFTSKVMGKAYGTKLMFPFPYNIAFKDACLNEFALSFLTMNIKPDEIDDNYEFVEAVNTMTGVVLGLEEPVFKEKNFVYKVPKKDAKTVLRKETVGSTDSDFWNDNVFNLSKCISLYLEKKGRTELNDAVFFLKKYDTPEKLKSVYENVPESEEERQRYNIFCKMAPHTQNDVIKLTRTQFLKLMEEQNGH